MTNKLNLTFILASLLFAIWLIGCSESPDPVVGEPITTVSTNWTMSIGYGGIRTCRDRAITSPPTSFTKNP